MAVLLAGTDEGPVSPDQVKALKASAVTIKALDVADEERANGSGFVIDAMGVVVTNRHVANMGGGAQLVAEFVDGTRRKVTRILAEHPKHDVALVQIEGQGYPA